MGRSGFCGRRARAARHPGYGRTGYCPRAPPARLEMGRSGFCARRARAAQHPGYGRTGYCPRAPPAALRWADLVFCARRARAARHPGYGRTGYCPRAPPAALRSAHLKAAGGARGQSGFCARARARRATSRLWANRVLPARAGSAALRWRIRFSRRARAARHPGYGRTGYCPRAPPAALRWADLVFASARRARAGIPVMGEPGIARARRLPP